MSALEERIKDYAKCFIVGMTTTMSLKNTEELLDKGNTEEAKEELQGALDILVDECLGFEECQRIRDSINEAIKYIEKGEADKAKEKLGTIVTIAFEKGKDLE
jgi:soluble cytochrome b562